MKSSNNSKLLSLILESQTETVFNSMYQEFETAMRGKYHTCISRDWVRLWEEYKGNRIKELLNGTVTTRTTGD